jgi:hypothetical protein
MPYPRQFWSLGFQILEIKRNDLDKDNRQLSVIIGADDPMMLEEESAIQFVKTLAEEKLDAKLIQNGEIKLYGQNCLAERTFYLIGNRKLFLVRSKPGGVDRIQEFLSQNCIGIGWTETGDLTNADKDDIRTILRQLGYLGHSLGQNVRIVSDFINNMMQGDVVLVPESDKNIVHVGIVGNYQWREEYRPIRMAHYREVKWVGHLGLNNLNELVQNFLKLPSTVNMFQHPIQDAELKLHELVEPPIG